jgi:AraC-like DNA-binding protein
MLHREFDPPDGLRDVIKCFWYNRRDFGKRESSFEVMPDGYAEIVFHFGSACTIEYSGASHALPSPFMMGLLNQPVLLSTKGVFEVVGIRCYPWTVFDLLDLPSGRDAVHLFEHPIALLQPVLHGCIQAGHIDEALARVEQVLLAARSRVAADSMLNKAGAAMRDAHGSLPVSEVATAAYATVRTLERKFKQSSGYTVKNVSGLMRFEQARNRLWLHPKTSLAALAHELGYTDQPHLSREFKRYSGVSPAAFARKATMRQEVLAGEFVAFLQS